MHAGVALLCAAGVASSLYLGWTEGSSLPGGVGFGGGFAAGWPHALNQPAYFTFLSAVLVCVTSAILAIRPERRSVIFHAIRLAGIVQAIITGLVFNVLLRSPEALTGVRLFNDTALHVIMPVLVPLVWLVFGPHGRLTWRSVVLSAVIPLLWLAVTLVRGPWLDWYPYDIMDVPGLGYSGVMVYVAVILAVYFLIASLIRILDGLLRQRDLPAQRSSDA